MKVIQIVVTLKYGDAIGNFSIMLHEKMKQNGINCYLYAQNAIGKAKDFVVSKNCLNNITESDLIIYQMCQADEINDFIKNAHCKKMAIYHNVTPPEFFTRWSGFMNGLQKQALEEISNLNNVFDRVVAVSEFNKNNLIQLGYPEKIDVVPLAIDYKDYQRKPNKSIIEQYSDDYINLLFVGRIAPNKKQEDVIRAYAYYKKHINEKSRLILIGSPFCSDYYNDLLSYIEMLGVTDVIIPGHIAFDEILAYYSLADCFVCLSEHEGFCVPLIEAMYFEVPIIAYDSSAIATTLDGGGILINDKEPCFVSLCINEIVNNDSIRNAIIDKQREILKKNHNFESVDGYIRIIKELIK